MKKDIKVLNRFGGSVTVKTSAGKRFNWSAMGSVVLMNEDEISDIYNQKGGAYLLEERLSIQDEAIVEKLGINSEPEYLFDIKTIEALLVQGTAAQIAEALEYNGKGFAETVRDVALKIKLEDLNKLGVISKALDINMINMREHAIDNSQEVKEVAVERPSRRNVFNPNAAKDAPKVVEARGQFKPSDDFKGTIEETVEEQEEPKVEPETSNKEVAKTTSKYVRVTKENK